jgi:hypothetical protein
MRALLQAERAARVVEQHAVHSALPGFGAVLDSILRHSYPAHRAEDGYDAALERAVERVVAEELMRLSTEAGMPQVRAIVVQKLELLQELASERRATRNPDDQAHFGLLETDISRYLNREIEDVPGPDAPELPPGSPIGGR